MGHVGGGALKSTGHGAASKKGVCAITIPVGDAGSVGGGWGLGVLEGWCCCFSLSLSPTGRLLA